MRLRRYAAGGLACRPFGSRRRSRPPWPVGQSAARTTALDCAAVRTAGAIALERAAELHAGNSHPADPLAAVRGRMDDGTREFLDYWFFPETQRELAALILAIRAEPDTRLRNLLEVVFSSTIVTKSGGVSRARDLAHTRPHRVADKQPRSALRQFEILLNRAADAYAAIDPNAVGKSSVIAGDSRRLPLQSDSVDLIVTSPPYANALDYMRAHKFSLAWLGEPIPRLSELRGRYIGAERQRNPSARQGNAAGVGAIGGKRVGRKRPAQVPASSPDTSATWPPPLARWRGVLRPGRAAVIVVGPSIMRGILIPTHQCLADIAAEAGLDVAAVAPRNLDRNRRMMPARRGSRAETASGIELRQYTEYVIGAVKP